MQMAQHLSVIVKKNDNTCPTLYLMKAKRKAPALTSGKRNAWLLVRRLLPHAKYTPMTKEPGTGGGKF